MQAFMQKFISWGNYQKNILILKDQCRLIIIDNAFINITGSL